MEIWRSTIVRSARPRSTGKVFLKLLGTQIYVGSSTGTGIRIRASSSNLPTTCESSASYLQPRECSVPHRIRCRPAPRPEPSRYDLTGHRCGPIWHAAKLAPAGSGGGTRLFRQGDRRRATRRRPCRRRGGGKDSSGTVGDQSGRRPGGRHDMGRRHSSRRFDPLWSLRPPTSREASSHDQPAGASLPDR